jgi:hypothetical protein
LANPRSCTRDSDDFALHNVQSWCHTNRAAVFFKT